MTHRVYTKESKMLKAAWTIGAVTALIICSPLSRGQAKASSGAAPAPRHDISGTWTPARGDGDGIQGQGAKDMPEDGKPEHQLPYTPLALEKMKDYRPGNGARQNVPGMINDPAVIYCDPQGMPRQDLYQLTTTQILQTPLTVLVLYQYSNISRLRSVDWRGLHHHP